MRLANKAENFFQKRSGGKSRGFLLLAVLIVPLLLPAQSFSQETQIQNSLFTEGSVAEERTRISRREASDLARAAFEGRVLSIRLERGLWRVRMDQDGKVFNVFVDANTGKVSRPSEQ